MSNSIHTPIPTSDVPAGAPALVTPDPAKVRSALRRRSVATLATVSAAGRPHAAAVLYQLTGDAVYVSTSIGSRKARNVAATGTAALTVLVRRLPVGPPASIQFQTTATVHTPDDEHIVALARSGALPRITSHGELDLADGCFLRLAMPERAATYGLGMSLWRLLRDPLGAAGQVTW